MRIYCFEIEGEPDWSSGKPVTALDRRTGGLSFLYRSHALANASADRYQAKAILERFASTQNGGPSVHLFSYGRHLCIAASDEQAAMPLLEEVRAKGLFPAAIVEPPSQPQPRCTRCGKQRYGESPLCDACARLQQRNKRSPAGFLAVLAGLLALLGLFLGVRACNSPKPLPEADFSANSTRVAKGQTVALNWSTSNASSVSIEPGIGPVEAFGSRSVPIQSTTTYILTASGPGGAVSRQITVDVYALKRNSQAPKPKQEKRFEENPPLTVPHLAPAPPMAPPQLSVSGDSVYAGDQGTLTWTTSNATSVRISPQPGEVQPSGSWAATLAATTTFTVTATGPGGETSRSATIYVTPRPAPVIQEFEIENPSMSPGQHNALKWRVSGSFSAIEVTETDTDKGSGCNFGPRSIYSSVTPSAAYVRLDMEPRCDAQYTLHVRSAVGTIDSRPVAVHIFAAPPPSYPAALAYPTKGSQPRQYGHSPVPGYAKSPGTTGTIVWTGDVDASTHRVAITWYLLRTAYGYVWQATNIQQGARIWDPDGTIFANQASFVSSDSSVQVVGSEYDGSHGAPHFTLTLHSDRAGQQSISLRWAKR